MSKKVKEVARTTMPVISFKISQEVYDKLAEYAKTLRDLESGVMLSPSKAARRLVIEALRKIK